MAASGTGIVWLRRDLRIRDNPALRAALDAHELVIPVFCFDDRLLHGRHESGTRTQFLLECLQDLDSELRERGSGLVVRHGKPERELVDLASACNAETIHFTREISPFGRERESSAARRSSRRGSKRSITPGSTRSISSATSVRKWASRTPSSAPSTRTG